MAAIRILIPTYNEKENITVLIPRVVAAVPEAKIVVIDDNSPDGTGNAVRELQKQYPTVELMARAGKNGLGSAYMDAFKKYLAEPDLSIVCTMDADLSHPPEELPAMIEKLKNADMVIGSRYVPGGKLIGWELWRKFLSACGNWYCRMVTGLPSHDCTSGYGAIAADFLRKMDWTDFDTSGYAFLMYLKYKLWQSGARLGEHPITFTNRVTGESKISMRIIEEGLLLPWRLIKKKDGATGDACPVCQSTQTNFWFVKNNCRLHRCGACALVFVSPIPQSFEKIYSQEYFCGATGGHGYVNYDSEKQSDQQTFAKYLEHLATNAPKKGTLLDIGAATGAFVQAAKNNGWDAQGVEMSDYAAATGRAKGLKITTGTLEAAALPNASFNAVTMWDVIEHIPEPAITLTEVHRILQPGGLLVINTPNIGSTTARLCNRFWPQIIPPEHVRLFNPKNLQMLLEKNGFTVTLVTRIGKRFTLAYIFQVLSTVWHSNFLKSVAKFFDKPSFNTIAIPLNMRDNMFVVAKKK